MLGAVSVAELRRRGVNFLGEPFVVEEIEPILPTKNAQRFRSSP
jgi:hypothetical protein